MKEKMTLSDFRKLLCDLFENGYGGFEDIVDVATSLNDEQMLSSRLMFDFGLDSLDIVELSMEIEKRYNVPSIEDAVDSDTTVQELLNLVNA